MSTQPQAGYIKASYQSKALKLEREKDYASAERIWCDAADMSDNQEERNWNVKRARDCFFKNKRSMFKVIQGGK